MAAQVREASRARSTAEFNAKVNRALQVADESQLWLELLHEECGIRGEDIEWLLTETSELLATFATIDNKTCHPH